MCSRSPRGETPWVRAIFEEVTAKEVSKLMKDTNPQIQEVLRVPSRKKYKETYTHSNITAEVLRDERERERARAPRERSGRRHCIRG